MAIMAKPIKPQAITRAIFDIRFSSIIKACPRYPYSKRGVSATCGIPALFAAYAFSIKSPSTY